MSGRGLLNTARAVVEFQRNASFGIDDRAEVVGSHGFVLGSK